MSIKELLERERIEKAKIKRENEILKKVLLFIWNDTNMKEIKETDIDGLERALEELKEQGLIKGDDE